MGQTARSIVWGRKRWGRTALSASALLMLVGATAPSAMAGGKKDDPATVSAPAEGDVRVIVMSDTSGKADQKVKGNHGKSRDKLDVADAVVADVSPDELAALQADPEVTVVPNLQVDVAGAADLVRAPAAIYPVTTGAATIAAKNGKNGKG